MKTIGTFTFPETGEELHDWTPCVMLKALDQKVLAVAQTRVEGAWAAYIGPVAGANHEREWPEVADHGTKLPESVARAIFTHIPKELRYAP